MNNDKHTSIRNALLARIQEGKILMRPRWHFVLKAALMLLGAIILGLAVLYVGSFAFFALRESGVAYAPAFGFSGVRAFILSLPWILILCALLFAFLLEILVRTYSFAYKKPLLYSVGGIVVVALMGSYILARIGIHERLERFAESGGIPVAKFLYRDFAHPRLMKIHPGSLVTTTPEGFVLLTPHGETFTVRVTPQTKFPEGFEAYEGTKVVIFGEKEGMFIEAQGVRPIDNFPPVPSRGWRVFIGPPR